MSVIIGNQTFRNPNVLRPRIEEVASAVGQTQGMVDYVEIMAEGYMALDNSKLDESKKKGVVTFVDGDLSVHAEQDKHGQLKSLEIIDNRGSEPQEFRKTMEDGRASYSISMGGQQAEIFEDANGTLVFA